MSALERCAQSEINSSYWERSVVIGGAAAFFATFFACRQNCSLVCRLVAIVDCGGFIVDVTVGEKVKWELCGLMQED